MAEDFMRQPNLFTEETIISLQQWAMTQPRNQEHYIQIKVYPPTIARITINEHDKVDLYIATTNMFVSQPDGIRTFANLGHSWYLSSIRNLVHPIDGISKKRWEL